MKKTTSRASFCFSSDASGLLKLLLVALAQTIGKHPSRDCNWLNVSHDVVIDVSVDIFLSTP